MLNATRDLTLPTTVTGSWPRPSWFTEVLHGRAFKDALGDSRFREQYMDAVSCIVKEQEAAGLDVVTDGDSRFDLTVGGKSWFFYPIERLLGITGHVDRSSSAGWTTIKPGRILYEVMEAYQPAVAGEKLRSGPLQYAALYKVAQRFSARPIKFGSISAQTISLKRKVSATGHETIDALKGAPEDIANAVAGVCILVKGSAAKGKGMFWSCIVTSEYSRTVHVDFRDMVSSRPAQREASLTENADELARKSRHGVPESLLHPSLRDGELYGKQLVLDDRARLLRHLKVCMMPSCPDTAHLREDLKAEIREHDRQRQIREQVEA